MSDTATLRTHLFDVLAGLKDKTLDLDRAKAINETAQTLINMAKVEVDYMKVTGLTLNNSMVSGQAQLTGPGTGTHTEQTQSGTKTTTTIPGGTVTTHRTR